MIVGTSREIESGFRGQPSDERPAKEQAFICTSCTGLGIRQVQWSYCRSEWWLDKLRKASFQGSPLDQPWSNKTV